MTEDPANGDSSTLIYIYFFVFISIQSTHEESIYINIFIISKEDAVNLVGVLEVESTIIVKTHSLLCFPLFISKQYSIAALYINVHVSFSFSFFNKIENILFWQKIRGKTYFYCLLTIFGNIFEYWFKHVWFSYTHRNKILKLPTRTKFFSN